VGAFKIGENEKMSIELKIEDIQRKIFAYDIEQIPALLTDLMSNIIEGQLFDLSDVRKVQIFNRIMQASMEAIQHRDYLLLADLIEFEMSKLLGINRMEKIVQ
jgi:hypothetical protein